MAEPAPLKVLSLFSGCGGLDYGFSTNPGFVVKKAYDNMPEAVVSYNMNHPNGSEELDVTRLLDPGFDLGFEPDVIVGGPPCQDFSVAGAQQLGKRASLTETFINIVLKHRPRYFVMENVPTIRSIGKTVYDRIVESLLSAGYALSTNVVSMPDYGVPQTRKRLIIVGVLEGDASTIDSLLATKKAPVQSMRDYMEQTSVDLGLEGKEHVYRHPRNYSRRGVFSIDENYPTVRGCLRRMPPTYTAHSGDTASDRALVHMPDVRFVSQIQTFPSDYKFAAKKTALIVGNSVPPRFSIVLAAIIAEHYSGS